MPRAPTAAEADRLARVILRKRLNLRPKEHLTIESYPTSLPWAAGFVREARRIGAYPMVHYEDEGSYWEAAEHGHAKVVGTLPKHETGALDETDAYVFFWGPENLDRVVRLPKKAQDEIFAFNPDWYKRAEKAGLRGVRMGIARVTEPNAKRFGVPFGAWRDQLLAASTRDPASFAPTVRRLERGLARRGTAHLTHPNGTDLTLALVERPIQRDLGIIPPKGKRGRFGMMVNVPPGSVYVTVDESTADGTIVANRRYTQGPILEGGRWTFEDGHLSSYDYAKGRAAFHKKITEATGAKDRPAFLEVGINPDLDRTPLLEENEYGAITVGVGNNTGIGGKSTSTMFDFLTLAGATLTIEGTTLVRGGRVV